MVDRRGVGRHRRHRPDPVCRRLHPRPRPRRRGRFALRRVRRRLRRHRCRPHAVLSDAVGEVGGGMGQRLALLLTADAHPPTRAAAGAADQLRRAAVETLARGRASSPAPATRPRRSSSRRPATPRRPGPSGRPRSGPPGPRRPPPRPRRPLLRARLGRPCRSPRQRRLVRARGTTRRRSVGRGWGRPPSVTSPREFTPAATPSRRPDLHHQGRPARPGASRPRRDGPRLRPHEDRQGHVPLARWNRLRTGWSMGTTKRRHRLSHVLTHWFPLTAQARRVPSRHDR